MSLFDDIDPAQFIVEFDERIHAAVVDGDDDLATVVDRFHTADILQVADGHPMDREKLIAHLRPTRKQRPSLRIEMGDALAGEDRLAARYRMHVGRPRGDDMERLTIDVHFFGRFAPDGRMRSAHILTRMERLGS